MTASRRGDRICRVAVRSDRQRMGKELAEDPPKASHRVASPGSVARLRWRSLVAVPQAPGRHRCSEPEGISEATGSAPPRHAALKRSRCRPDILDGPSSDAERRVPVVTQAPVKGRQAVKVNFVLPKDAVAGNVSVSATSTAGTRSPTHYGHGVAAPAAPW